jgi:hypothetical protein
MINVQDAAEGQPLLQSAGHNGCSLLWLRDAELVSLS